MKRPFRLSTGHLLSWITFLAIFAMAAKPSIDSDTWWHLRTGQWIVENQQIPQADPFSYTRFEQPWHPPGWIFQVPMFWIYQIAGPGGLNLLTAALVTLAFWFIWRTMEGGVFMRAFLLILAAAASGVYWAARPYLITFVLAAVYLAILESVRWMPAAPAEERRRREKRLWWLPVLMILWANGHGGFAIGFILLGIYGLAELVRLGRVWLQDRPALGQEAHLFTRMVITGVLMLAAVCMNPFGPVLLAYAFETVSINALQNYILEWQSPNFHLAAAQPTIWLLIVLIGALGVSRRRIALTDFLLAGGFLYMALLAWRNVALFALVAPVIIARHAAPVLAALSRRVGFQGGAIAVPPRRQSTLNLVLLMLIGLAVGVKVTSDFLPETNQAALRAIVPVDAVAYLKQNHLPGRLFNAYNWGSYLLWELPEYPVFIDGRTDLYNDEVISQWLVVVQAEPGWQEMLDRWQVRLILLEPTAPVTRLLEAAGWQTRYQDDQAAVFSR